MAKEIAALQPGDELSLIFIGLFEDAGRFVFKGTVEGRNSEDNLLVEAPSLEEEGIRNIGSALFDGETGLYLDGAWEFDSPHGGTYDQITGWVIALPYEQKRHAQLLEIKR